MRIVPKKPITVRLSEENLERLDEIARWLGTSTRSETVQALVMMAWVTVRKDP